MRWLSGLLADIAPRMRSQARRLPPPPWRSRRGAAVSVAAAAIVATGIGGWIWQLGWPQQAAAAVRSTVADTTAGFGLAVDQVYVIGRKHADRAALIDALDVERGDPILFVDLDEARARISALSWVAGASVERLLPNVIVVHLQERSPLALWQLEGRFSVIDAEGYVLARDSIARYSELTLVVGDHAPEAAADFVSMIDSQPELALKVKAGVRVSGRRWDVHLSSGTQIRLPEERADEAWAQLAGYYRQNGILEKRPNVIDLRVPGRVTVEPSTPDTMDVGDERSI